MYTMCMERSVYVYIVHVEYVQSTDIVSVVPKHEVVGVWYCC